MSRRQVQAELQGDDRGAGRALRGHLVQRGIWPNCRSSGAVTDEVITSGLAPGIEGLDLDRRIVDCRQRRDRQVEVRHHADEQDRQHQERRGDRPQDEEAGRVHGCSCPSAPCRRDPSDRLPIPMGPHDMRGRRRPHVRGVGRGPDGLPGPLPLAAALPALPGRRCRPLPLTPCPRACPPRPCRSTVRPPGRPVRGDPHAARRRAAGRCRPSRPGRRPSGLGDHAVRVPSVSPILIGRTTTLSSPSIR